jgi:uncharacterized membrane protein
MVQARRDPDGSTSEFVIRPNASLSWQDAKTFFATMCTLSMGIALTFYLLGAWLILPFAGLEMAGLGAALYYCAYRAGRVEVVTIHAGVVEVAKGRGKLTERWTFPRHWAQVSLEAPSHEWYASRLRIVSHGRGVEVGGCLNEDERRGLAGELMQALRT